ncbi:hypothetical protein JCM8097_004641 [Rhodosporidiobolus ruineniae]
MPVEFQHRRVGRPPEGGQLLPRGLGECAPLRPPSRGADQHVDPDALLRLLDDLTAESLSSSSSSTSSMAPPPSSFVSTGPPYTPLSTSSFNQALRPGPSTSVDAFGFTAASFPFSSDSSSSFKGQVDLQLSSAFAAPAKAFDAGDILLPFDLDAGPSSFVPTANDLVAYPVLAAAAVSTSMSPADVLAFDASLDSPLGTSVLGSANTSPLSEFLASPMFSVPESAAASTTISELPLPSPVDDLNSSAPSLSWFPPLPSTSTLSAPSGLDFSFPDFPPSTSAFAPPPPPAPTPLPSSSSSRTSSTKPKPTGFRAGSTPLLPMDAPIQSRNSVVPSATSRKRKTAAAEKALAKRRKGGDDSVDAPAPAADEEEELPADIVAAVERKRLQNTLSARKSRARKQARLQELETENEALKQRVEELERMLGMANGL